MNEIRKTPAMHKRKVLNSCIKTQTQCFLGAFLWKTSCRSTRPEVFCIKGALKNFAKFTGKHLCQSPLFNKVAGPQACNFTKKETLEQVFSCEFCEIFKNTFFYRTPSVAASVSISFRLKNMGSLPNFASNIKQIQAFIPPEIIKKPMLGIFWSYFRNHLFWW